MNEEATAGTGLGKRVLTYAATLLVAAIAIYGISEFLTPVQPPKRGDCAYLTGNVGAGRYNAVACSDSSANYVAEGTVAKSQSCPNSEDMSWVPVRAVDPDVRFCLVPLYVEGECYTSSKSGYDLTIADCGAHDAFRVTAVSRNVPAPACAAGEQTRAYPEVKLTYCLGRA
ncbi:LppU/SCO3897 family protein [Lentzea nigeriaca]|uniref:LppU/SCO3897 family protein n=1 Tax=Lentzea nigeriaca TaxID=1128665 RepID=UPI003FD7E263